MTEERLAEIRERVRATKGTVTESVHATELLAYVDELRAELEATAKERNKALDDRESTIDFYEDSRTWGGW